MAARLDAPTLRRAMSLFAESLRGHRDELNSLNVYPVPDGDTGTNLLLTQEAVERALATAADGNGLPELCRAIARSSLMGARGNSGVILSQILRGLCQVLSTDGSGGPRELAVALQHGSDEAYRAVARPVEGTVLTVLRDAAGAANGAATSGASLEAVAAAALKAARASLARTRDALPELRVAGVVDAGGKGVVLLLDALSAAVAGGVPSEPVGPPGPLGRAEEPALSSLEFAYEVQYLLEARDEALPSLRQALDRLGDSLVVVGGGEMFNVHVHTNDPESAVEAARAVGCPREVSITPLEGRMVSCLSAQAREVRIAEQTCALVAVAEGEGLVRAFASLGALVVRGGPVRDPPVLDLLAAIEAAPADAVLILGNDWNVIPVAERAAAESTKDTRVVPSSAAPSGLAAAAAFNPLLSLEINVKAMAEAALACRSGELVPAERDARTPAGPVRRGDWLGVVEGEVMLVGASIDRAAVGVARRLGPQDPEILTVITGAEARAADSDAVGRALRQAFPEAVVEVVAGGQPGHPFLIGVE